MSQAARIALVLDMIEERGVVTYRLDSQVNDTIYEAMKLAHVVAKLIEFGGGNLALPDGRVFKFVETCDACQNAVRMFTRAGLQSRFCVRCADSLANKAFLLKL